jgi:hypothetical protein
LSERRGLWNFLKITKNVKKTSGGKKSNFIGEFGVSKIVEPARSGDRQIRIFLIDFDIWNVEIGVCIQKLWLFYERTPN